MASQSVALIMPHNEDSVVSGQPKPVRINDHFAMELLDKLLQFVSLKLHRNFQPSKDERINDTSMIVIARRFDLRYVCLCWHNIVHRSAFVLLFAEYGNKLDLFVSFPRVRDVMSPHYHFAEYHVAKRRKSLELLKSSLRVESKTERKGVWWFNLIDCIQSADVRSFVCVDDSPHLGQLVSAIADLAQPVDLELCLFATQLPEWRAIIGQPNEELISRLTLRKLTWRNSIIWEYVENFADVFEDVSRWTRYLLEAGKQTLLCLDINLPALDSMPEGWVCESLQKLDLNIEPYPSWESWSEDEARQEIAKQARLPRLFPQLETLTLRSAAWPHLDFSVLTEMEHLKELELYLRSNLRREGPHCRLPKIESLAVHEWFLDRLPVRLSEFVPNVQNLTFATYNKNACMELLGQMSGKFPQLSDISLTFLGRDLRQVPPAGDVIALFVAWRQLPALKSLAFDIFGLGDAEWYRPGDFSLLQVLPRSLISCKFRYCLLPAPVTISPDGIYFIFDPNIPDAEEAIYKAWFRNAVHYLCDLPLLELFHCRICAPSFHVAVSLAAKWSKSSSAAIDDFGVANVINISCSTEAYLSIEPGQRYESFDTIKLRFTLAKRRDFVDDNGFTRQFTFELENPYMGRWQLSSSDQ